MSGATVSSESVGLRLGVNIDHVATLRQARGTTYPSVVEAAKLCERAGAHGITVHLREDRRHIQDQDVYELRAKAGLPLNLEMAVHPAICAIACDVKPAEVCLVPERRQELTTEGGLDVVGNRDAVANTVRQLQERGIEVSLFVDPDPVQVEAAVAVGAGVIELHTGAFCDAGEGAGDDELNRLQAAARQARAAGLRVNAGHGISLDNIDAILRVPCLDTLNIGHSIVCRSLFVGLQQAVHEMLRAMSGYGGDA